MKIFECNCKGLYIVMTAILTGLNVGVKISVSGGRSSVTRRVGVMVLLMLGGTSVNIDVRRWLFIC